MRFLTGELERQIGMDWANCFPELRDCGHLHLLRRVGPLVVGIALERDSSGASYLPTFHVHCLAVAQEYITLSLPQPLRTVRTGAPERIDVRWHQEKFREAAERVANQAPLPLTGDLKMEAVLDVYRSRLQAPDIYRYQPALYEEMALICAWASRVAEARAIVQDGLREMHGWPEYVRQKLGNLESWGSRLLEQVSDPKAVRARVERQAQLLGLEGLPRGEMI
jgi:hypothetical protein